MMVSRAPGAALLLLLLLQASVCCNGTSAGIRAPRRVVARRAASPRPLRGAVAPHGGGGGVSALVSVPRRVVGTVVPTLASAEDGGSTVVVGRQFQVWANFSEGVSGVSAASFLVTSDDAALSLSSLTVTSVAADAWLLTANVASPSVAGAFTFNMTADASGVSPPNAALATALVMRYAPPVATLTVPAVSVVAGVPTLRYPTLDVVVNFTSAVTNFTSAALSVTSPGGAPAPTVGTTTVVATSATVYTATLTFASPLIPGTLVFSVPDSAPGVSPLPANKAGPPLTISYAPPVPTLTCSVGVNGTRTTTHALVFTAVFSVPVAGVLPSAFAVTSSDPSWTPSSTIAMADVQGSGSTYTLTVRVPDTIASATLGVSVPDSTTGVSPPNVAVEALYIEYYAPTVRFAHTVQGHLVTFVATFSESVSVQSTAMAPLLPSLYVTSGGVLRNALSAATMFVCFFVFVFCHASACTLLCVCLCPPTNADVLSPHSCVCCVPMLCTTALCCALCFHCWMPNMRGNLLFWGTLFPCSVGVTTTFLGTSDGGTSWTLTVTLPAAVGRVSLGLALNVSHINPRPYSSSSSHPESQAYSLQYDCLAAASYTSCAASRLYRLTPGSVSLNASEFAATPMEQVSNATWREVAAPPSHAIGGTLWVQVYAPTPLPVPGLYVVELNVADQSGRSYVVRGVTWHLCCGAHVVGRGGCVCTHAACHPLHTCGMWWCWLCCWFWLSCRPLSLLTWQNCSWTAPPTHRQRFQVATLPSLGLVTCPAAPCCAQCWRYAQLLLLFFFPVPLTSDRMLCLTGCFVLYLVFVSPLPSSVSPCACSSLASLLLLVGVRPSPS